MLYQNYPNPFNPVTTISPRNSKTTLEIYNILGEEIITLVNGSLSAGTHKINFDGSGFPAGVYIYRLTMQPGNYSSSRKLVLLK